MTKAYTNWVLDNAKKNLNPEPMPKWVRIPISFSDNHPSKLVDSLNEVYQQVPPQSRDGCILSVDYGEDFFDLELIFSRDETPEEIQQRIEGANKTIKAQETFMKQQYEQLKAALEVDSEKSSEKSS